MSKSGARRIVITGVSRGLGLAMVEGLIARGHTVCGCARSGEAVRKLQATWQAPHQFEQVDVASDSQVKDWATSVLAKGDCDLLLNNAAVVNHNAPLWTISAADFDQVLAVNVSGVVNCIRHFVPAMVVRRRGVIVNFSSGWGRSTAPEVAPYCATKFAIEGLTQALAQELPGGMAAVPLNPGIIDTDMLRSCFGAASKSYPSPAAWADKAVPFILQLGEKDNGEPLSVRL